MKKTIVLLAAFAFSTAGASFAQSDNASPRAMQATKTKNQQPKPKKTPEQKADQKAAKMARELGLTADQEGRIEQIMLARQQEKKVLKAKFGQDRQSGQPAMKAAKERYHAQLKQVLTAGQYAKFTRMNSEEKGRGPGQGTGKKLKAKGKA